MALSLSHAAYISSQVVGKDAMPALVKSSLL